VSTLHHGTASLGRGVVGDYSTETMDPDLLANAISALATLHGSLGLEPMKLKLHREDPLTDAPLPWKRDIENLIHYARFTAKLTTAFPGRTS